MSSDVNKTLDERGERYGKFRNHAELSQKLLGYTLYKAKPVGKERERGE